MADTTPIDPILRRPQVLRLCGFSDSTLHRLIRQKEDPFPPPVKLGPRAVGWRESAVRKWIDSRNFTVPGNLAEAEPLKAPAHGRAPESLEI